MPGLLGKRPWFRLLLAAAAMAASAVSVSAAEPEALPALDLAPLAILGERIGNGREAIKKRGIEIGVSYIGDVLSNLKGGLRRGTVYQGRLDVQVDADLGTLMGRDGLSFHANAYQIHGTGLSRYYVGNLATVSGIEALPATRLHELWFEQAFLDKAVTVRAGKLAADAEFFVSPSATLFMNATFGWPVIAATNLPSGGPAAPLAAPGIRAKWNPTEQTTLMLGLFSGDPAGRGVGTEGLDPQRRNPDGTDFSLRGEPFAIAEAAYRYTLDTPGPERTGTVKVGYFHHFGKFDDPHFDTLGGSLADPASNGVPRRRRGDDGIYGLIDQTLYREDASSDRGAAAFVRVAASPNATSLVDFYADAGLVYKGLLPGRPADVTGISIAYSQIARGVQAYDRDLILLQEHAIPVHRSETVVELSYQAVVAPGFTIQPDVQFIKSPGGHTWNPRRQTFSRIKDSAVIGIRATIQY